MDFFGLAPRLVQQWIGLGSPLQCSRLRASGPSWHLVRDDRSDQFLPQLLPLFGAPRRSDFRGVGPHRVHSSFQTQLFHLECIPEGRHGGWPSERWSPSHPRDDKEITLYDIATAANMDGNYNSHYRFYCQFPHGALRAMVGGLSSSCSEDNYTVASCVLGSWKPCAAVL